MLLHKLICRLLIIVLEYFLEVKFQMVWLLLNTLDVFCLIVLYKYCTIFLLHMKGYILFDLPSDIELVHRTKYLKQLFSDIGQHSSKLIIVILKKRECNKVSFIIVLACYPEVISRIWWSEGEPKHFLSWRHKDYALERIHH